MGYFEHLSFGEAVSLVQTVGILCDLLFLTLPLAAAMAIRRGKKNRPGTLLFFPRFVFWGWFVLLAAAIVYFFTGAWYGENGPPPQEAAAEAVVSFVCISLVVAAIYAGLYISTGPRDVHRHDAA